MLHNGELVSIWWNDIFHNATHQGSRFFILHILFAVFIIVIIGVIADTFWKVLCHMVKK